jgi:hypothetical protein
MMRNIYVAVLALALAACSGPEAPVEKAAKNEASVQEKEPVVPEVTRAAPQTVEDRFVILALDCVQRQYPNKISHVLQSDADAKTPRELTPVFYGCYDWHSAVHGHWLLTRILSLNPQSAYREEILAALSANITPENIAVEVEYYTGPGRASFERPYGIAWFLQLVAELEETQDAELKDLRPVLQPLEEKIVAQINDWLPKLAYPIRLGTHNQTAFAFGLMLDYARTVRDEELEQLLTDKVLAFHQDDVNCPLAYEPSGEDFLSPCLMEADLMRRVMDEEVFSAWLSAFLPGIPEDGRADWLTPGVVLDASDGKLVHLDGVNLSRAWALEGIASALPAEDPRQASLRAAADIHRETGVAAVSDEHYAGSHWLASFATYLTTERGLN